MTTRSDTEGLRAEIAQALYVIYNERDFFAGNDERAMKAALNDAPDIARAALPMTPSDTDPRGLGDVEAAWEGFWFDEMFDLIPVAIRTRAFNEHRPIIEAAIRAPLIAERDALAEDEQAGFEAAIQESRAGGGLDAASYAKDSGS